MVYISSPLPPSLLSCPLIVSSQVKETKANEKGDDSDDGWSDGEEAVAPPPIQKAVPLAPAPALKAAVKQPPASSKPPPKRVGSVKPDAVTLPVAPQQPPEQQPTILEEEEQEEQQQPQPPSQQEQHREEEVSESH
jgi:hypothetical protein